MQLKFQLRHRTALLLLAILIPCVVLGKPPKQVITVGHPLAWGGSCQPGFLRVLAGSHYYLEVVSTADTLAQPLVSGWPEGYVLEAALDLPLNVPFVPTPGLIEQMSPTRYLSQLNRVAANGLRRNPATFWDWEDLNAKDFILTIPANLVGHTVNFRALYQRDGFNLISKRTEPITIVAPCDRSDTARIVATLVYEAWNVGDFPRACELADSMLASDLSDAGGWYCAESAARGMKRYDKAMTYLQRMYEDFGVMEIELNTDRPPQLNRGGVRDARLQHAYQSARNKYLRLKAEQEQQQQPQR